MKGYIFLIIALIIETVLISVLLVMVLVGILGVFLPVLPGVLFFGIAAGIYSLLVRSKYGVFTSKFHRQAIIKKDVIMNLKLTKKIMFIFDTIKKRQREKSNEQILKHGLVLCGFNLALLLLFTFGFIGISLLAVIFELQGVMLAFVPLAVMFIFSAISAVVWYRFGQILGSRFKKRKMLNSSLVVLISILPLLIFLLIFAGILNKFKGAFDEVLAVLFLGDLLLATLAAIFELIIVNLGVMTSKK